MNPMDRYILPSESVFAKKSAVEAVRIGVIENVEEPGMITVKPQMVGEDMIFIEAFKGKGTIDPMHQHDDHESIGYLLSGRMRMVIGGEETIVEPGDVWRHPRGVPHLSEALEDSIQLEIKSPPRKTWYTAAELASGQGS